MNRNITLDLEDVVELHSNNATCYQGHELILLTEGLGYCSFSSLTGQGQKWVLWKLGTEKNHLSIGLYSSKEEMLAGMQVQVQVNYVAWANQLMPLPTMEELYGRSV